MSTAKTTNKIIYTVLILFNTVNTKDRAQSVSLVQGRVFRGMVEILADSELIGTLKSSLTDVEKGNYRIVE